MTGCKKCVETKYETVEVMVTDEYHHGAYVTYHRVGKINQLIPHPATYRITVSYQNVEYDLNHEDTYNKYKDKVVQTAIGTLQTNIYDDGSESHKIIGLK